MGDPAPAAPSVEPHGRLSATDRARVGDRVRGPAFTRALRVSELRGRTLTAFRSSRSARTQGLRAPVRSGRAAARDTTALMPWQPSRRTRHRPATGATGVPYLQRGPGPLAIVVDLGRIAARLHSTILEPDLPASQLVARQVLDRIARLVGRFGCNGVVLVLEESQRTDRLAATYFSGYDLEVRSSSGPRPLEMLRFRMPKAAAEPFLEVADFVVHAAGGQVRSHLKGLAWGARRDYRAVFGITDQTLVEFIEALSVKWGPPVA